MNMLLCQFVPVLVVAMSRYELFCALKRVLMTCIYSIFRFAGFVFEKFMRVCYENGHGRTPNMNIKEPYLIANALPGHESRRDMFKGEHFTVYSPPIQSVYSQGMISMYHDKL